MDKFAQKKPTCIAYDEKLQFYSNLVIEVRKWFFSPRLVGRFRHIDYCIVHAFLPCPYFRSFLETEKYLHRRHSQILKWPFA